MHAQQEGRHPALHIDTCMFPHWHVITHYVTYVLSFHLTHTMHPLHASFASTELAQVNHSSVKQKLLLVDITLFLVLHNTTLIPPHCYYLGYHFPSSLITSTLLWYDNRTPSNILEILNTSHNVVYLMSLHYQYRSLQLYCMQS